MITDSGFDPIPRCDSKSAPGLLIPAPSLLLVNPRCGQFVHALSLPRRCSCFLGYVILYFCKASPALLLQSSLRLMVTVAVFLNPAYDIFFSARDSRRVSISATTASVFESVAPAGMVTLSLNSVFPRYFRS
jgi:hypothetical protein